MCLHGTFRFSLPTLQLARGRGALRAPRARRFQHAVGSSRAVRTPTWVLSIVRAHAPRGTTWLIPACHVPLLRGARALSLLIALRKSPDPIWAPRSPPSALYPPRRARGGF